MQLAITILASVLGGGLAGACVSVAFNRLFHRQDLRIKFYPVLNNMHSAYVIRMENPEGRYWTNTIGYLPSPEDAGFVKHRSNFMDELVEYVGLKEVRVLRRQFAANMMSGNHKVGEVSKLDLTPESAALTLCLVTLHKKLKI
jgi:hypothetical protein